MISQENKELINLYIRGALESQRAAELKERIINNRELYDYMLEEYAMLKGIQSFSQKQKANNIDKTGFVISWKTLVIIILGIIISAFAVFSLINRNKDNNSIEQEKIEEKNTSPSNIEQQPEEDLNIEEDKSKKKDSSPDNKDIPADIPIASDKSNKLDNDIDNNTPEPIAMVDKVYQKYSELGVIKERGSDNSWIEKLLDKDFEIAYQIILDSLGTDENFPDTILPNGEIAFTLGIIAINKEKPNYEVAIKSLSTLFKENKEDKNRESFIYGFAARFHSAYAHWKMGNIDRAKELLLQIDERLAEKHEYASAQHLLNNILK